MPFQDELIKVQELRSLKPEVESLRVEADKLRTEVERSQTSRLAMLIADALVDLARLMASQYKAELGNDTSTVRLQQSAADLEDDQLQKMEIPTKYWHPLRRLDQYISARNQQAHETSEEFAQVLLFAQFRGHVFEMWKDVFALLYGASVKEIAARKKWRESQILLGTL